MTADVAADTATRGKFFVPAIALAIAGLICGIASLANSFEGLSASMVAVVPTVAAVVLGHMTMSPAQPLMARRATLGGLGLAYLALVLVVVSLLT